MAQLVQYDAKYGAETTFYFTFENPADADDLFTGDATNFAAGDVKLSKDGGAAANTTNLPVQITASQPLYSLTLTAAEMQAEKAIVSLRDATATEVFGPVTLVIDTVKRLGRLVIDATALSDVAAFVAAGAGTGAGIYGIAGATGEGILAQGTAGYGIRAFTAVSGPGIAAEGGGANAGIIATGGATGAGIRAVGGATSGNGIIAVGTNGNSAAIKADGQGSAAGLIATGGATGVGISAVGGATSGAGISAVGTAGNAAGILATGQGSNSGIAATGGATGHGILATGGATSGNGIAATATTSGQGIYGAGAGTGAGLNVIGGATGSGVLATGGATSGHGIAATATTSGNGIAAVGIGTGHGYSGTAGASGKICNFFETVEGTEPSAALADNAQFGVILQWLKRRFHGKSTCTATQLKVYKDDESTVLSTQSVADDGTTQTTGVAS